MIDRGGGIGNKKGKSNHDLYDLFPNMKPEISKEDAQNPTRPYSDTYRNDQIKKNETYEKVTGHSYTPEPNKNSVNNYLINNVTKPIINVDNPINRPTNNTTQNTTFNNLPDFPSAQELQKATSNHTEYVQLQKILEVAKKNPRVYALLSKHTRDLVKTSLTAFEKQILEDAKLTEDDFNFYVEKMKLSQAAILDSNLQNIHLTKEPHFWERADWGENTSFLDGFTIFIHGLNGDDLTYRPAIDSQGRPYTGGGTYYSKPAPTVNYGPNNGTAPSAVTSSDYNTTFDQKTVNDTYTRIEESAAKERERKQKEKEEQAAWYNLTEEQNKNNYLNGLDQDVRQIYDTATSIENVDITNLKDPAVKAFYEKQLNIIYEAFPQYKGQITIEDLASGKAKKLINYKANNEEEYETILESLYASDPQYKKYITLDDFKKAKKGYSVTRNGFTVTYDLIESLKETKFEIDLDSLRNGIVETATNLKDFKSAVDLNIDETWQQHVKEVEDYKEQNAYRSLYQVIYNQGTGLNFGQRFGKWADTKWYSYGEFKADMEEAGIDPEHYNFSDYIKAGSKHELMAVINELETFDIGAAWIKGGVKALINGESYDKYVKSILGLDPNSYGIASTNDYESGNAFVDFIGEVVSDPLDWIEFGAGGVIKSSSKNILEKIAAKAPTKYIKVLTKTIDDAGVIKHADFTEDLLGKILKRSDDVTVSKQVSDLLTDTITDNIDVFNNAIKTQDVSEVAQVLKKSGINMDTAEARRFISELTQDGTTNVDKLKYTSLMQQLNKSDEFFANHKALYKEYIETPNARQIKRTIEDGNVFKREIDYSNIYDSLINKKNMNKDVASAEFLKQVAKQDMTETVDAVTYGARLLGRTSDAAQKAILVGAVANTPIPYTVAAFKNKFIKRAVNTLMHKNLKLINKNATGPVRKAYEALKNMALDRTHASVIDQDTRIKRVLTDPIAIKQYEDTGVVPFKYLVDEYDFLLKDNTVTDNLELKRCLSTVNLETTNKQLRQLGVDLGEAATKTQDDFLLALKNTLEFLHVEDVETLYKYLDQYAELEHTITKQERKKVVDYLKRVIDEELTSFENTGHGTFIARTLDYKPVLNTFELPKIDTAEDWIAKHSMAMAGPDIRMHAALNINDASELAPIQKAASDFVNNLEQQLGAPITLKHFNDTQIAFDDFYETFKKTITDTSLSEDDIKEQALHTWAGKIYSGLNGMRADLDALQHADIEKNILTLDRVHNLYKTELPVLNDIIETFKALTDVELKPQSVNEKYTAASLAQEKRLLKQKGVGTPTAVKKLKTKSDVIYQSTVGLSNTTRTFALLKTLNLKSSFKYIITNLELYKEVEDWAVSAIRTESLIKGFNAFEQTTAKIESFVQSYLSEVPMPPGTKQKILNTIYDKIVLNYALSPYEFKSKLIDIVYDYNAVNSIKRNLSFTIESERHLDVLCDKIYEQLNRYADELITIGLEEGTLDYLKCSPDFDLLLKTLPDVEEFAEVRANILNTFKELDDIDAFYNKYYKVYTGLKFSTDGAVKQEHIATRITKAGKTKTWKVLETPTARELKAFNFSEVLGDAENYKLAIKDRKKFRVRTSAPVVSRSITNPFDDISCFVSLDTVKTNDVFEELSLINKASHATYDRYEYDKKLLTLLDAEYSNSASLSQVAKDVTGVAEVDGSVHYFTNISKEQITKARALYTEQLAILKGLDVLPDYLYYTSFDNADFIVNGMRITGDDLEALRINKNFAICYKAHSNIRYWATDVLERAKARCAKLNIDTRDFILIDYKPYMPAAEYNTLVKLNDCYAKYNITNKDMLIFDNISFAKGETDPTVFQLADTGLYSLTKTKPNFRITLPKYASLETVHDGELLVGAGLNNAIYAANHIPFEADPNFEKAADMFYNGPGTLNADTRKMFNTLSDNSLTKALQKLMRQDVDVLKNTIYHNAGGFIYIDKALVAPEDVAEFSEFLKTIQNKGIYVDDIKNNIICLSCAEEGFAKDTFIKITAPDIKATPELTPYLKALTQAGTKIDSKGVIETYELMSTESYKVLRDALPEHVKKRLPSMDVLRSNGYLTGPKNSNFYLSSTARKSFIGQDWGVRNSVDYISSLKSYLNYLETAADTRAKFANNFIDDRIRLNTLSGGSEEYYKQIRKSKGLTGIVMVQSVKKMPDGTKQIVPKAKTINLTNCTIADLKRLNPAIVSVPEAKQLTEIFNDKGIPNLFEETLLTLSSIYKANALSRMSWLKNNFSSTLFKDLISGRIGAEDIPARIGFMFKTLETFKRYDRVLKDLIEYSTDYAPEDIRILAGSNHLYSPATIDAFFKNPKYADFKDTFIDIEVFLTHGPASITNVELDAMARANIIKGQKLGESLKNGFERLDKTYAGYVDNMSKTEYYYRYMLQSAADVAWKNPLTRRITDANNYIEQFFRYDTYRWEREAGATFGEATDVVKNVHFDYETEGWVKGLDFIMPFVNYQYANVVFWADAIWKNPTLARWFMSYYKANGAADLTEDDLDNNELWASRLLNGSIDLTPDLTLTINSDVFDFFQHTLNPLTYIEDVPLYNYFIKPYYVEKPRGLREIARQREAYEKAIDEVLKTDTNSKTREEWYAELNKWEAAQKAELDNSIYKTGVGKFNPESFIAPIATVEKFIKNFKGAYEDDPAAFTLFRAAVNVITSMPSFFARNGKKYFYYFDEQNLTAEQWERIKNDIAKEKGYDLLEVTPDKTAGERTYSTRSYAALQKLMQNNSLIHEGANPSELKHYLIQYTSWDGTVKTVRVSDRYTAISMLAQNNSKALNKNATELQTWCNTKMPEGYLDMVDAIKKTYRYSYASDPKHTVYGAFESDKTPYTSEEQFINAAITGDIIPENALAYLKLKEYSNLLTDLEFIKAYDTKFMNIRYSYTDQTGMKIFRCIQRGAAEDSKKLPYAVLQLANGCTPENDIAKQLLESRLVQELKSDKEKFYSYADKNNYYVVHWSFADFNKDIIYGKNNIDDVRIALIKGAEAKTNNAKSLLKTVDTQKEVVKLANKKGYYVIHWDFLNKDLLYSKDNLDKVLEALRKGGKPVSDATKALMSKYDITPIRYNYNKYRNYYTPYQNRTYQHKAPINKFFYGGKQYVTRDPNKFQNALQNGATLTPNAAPHKVKHSYAYNKARYYQKNPKTYNWTPHKYNRYNSNFYTNSNITTTVPYSAKQKSYRKRRVVSRNMMQRKYRMKYKFNK